MMHLNSKVMSTKNTDYIQLPYKSCRTCLINHMGFISYQITPLVINNLGGGHTHSHMHTDLMDKRNSKKPGAHQAY